MVREGKVKSLMLGGYKADCWGEDDETNLSSRPDKVLTNMTLIKDEEHECQSTLMMECAIELRDVDLCKYRL